MCNTESEKLKRSNGGFVRSKSYLAVQKQMSKVWYKFINKKFLNENYTEITSSNNTLHDVFVWKPLFVIILKITYHMF